MAGLRNRLNIYLLKRHSCNDLALEMFHGYVYVDRCVQDLI